MPLPLKGPARAVLLAESRSEILAHNFCGFAQYTAQNSISRTTSQKRERIHSEDRCRWGILEVVVLRCCSQRNGT